MNIIGTGLSGLIGSRVVSLLSHSYSFTNLSLETGVDITKPGVVDAHISASDSPWIFHFAAMTDVDGAEKEKDLKASSRSWMVNVESTRYIATAAARYNKRILYVSTDFVFDGTKQSYTEEDKPHPLGWYAVTKYEGEKIVKTVPGSLIIRIANPYCSTVNVRPDFVHTMIGLLRNGQKISAPDDQIFVPTFVDDIAYAIDQLVSRNAQGIYHVVGTGSISPYRVAQMLAAKLQVDSRLVSTIPFQTYFENRAPRPQYAYLTNDKIRSEGIHMSTFEEGIAKIDLLKGNK